MRAVPKISRWMAAGITLAATVVLIGSAHGQEETYDLLGPPLEKGKTIKVTSSMEMKKANLIIEFMGQTLKGNADLKGEDEQRVTILETDGHRVIKTRTDVVKDQVTTKRSILGEGEEETKDGELVGRFVTSLWDKKDWTNTLEGNAPDDDQLEALETFIPLWQEMNLFPKEKVKVGHSWEPSIEDWAIAFGGKMKNVEGKIESTFTKVIDIDGDPCAVIESKVKFKGRLPKEKEPLDVIVEGKLISHRSLKTGLDVEETFKGEFEFSGDLEEDGVKIKLSMSGPVTLKGKEEFAGLAID